MIGRARCRETVRWRFGTEYCFFGLGGRIVLSPQWGRTRESEEYPIEPTKRFCPNSTRLLKILPANTTFMFLPVGVCPLCFPTLSIPLNAHGATPTCSRPLTGFIPGLAELGCCFPPLAVTVLCITVVCNCDCAVHCLVTYTPVPLLLTFFPYRALECTPGYFLCPNSKCVCVCAFFNSCLIHVFP